MLLLEAESSKMKAQAMEEAMRSLSVSDAQKPAAALAVAAAVLSPVSGGASEPASSMPHKRMKLAPLKLAEFEELEQHMVGKGKIPPGTESKNRYMNILPTPRTRVVLEQIGADETSKYINANHIQGHTGFPREYIATQGPTAATTPDFWRMVWQYNVKAVVMVTGLVEKGVEKCARYWPKVLYNEKEKIGDSQYGEINVRVVEGARRDGYITSNLRVRRNEVERSVRHFWFDSWPDHGAIRAMRRSM